MEKSHLNLRNTLAIAATAVAFNAAPPTEAYAQEGPAHESEVAYNLAATQYCGALVARRTINNVEISASQKRAKLEATIAPANASSIAQSAETPSAICDSTAFNAIGLKRTFQIVEKTKKGSMRPLSEIISVAPADTESKTVKTSIRIKKCASNQRSRRIGVADTTTYTQNGETKFDTLYTEKENGTILSTPTRFGAFVTAKCYKRK